MNYVKIVQRCLDMGEAMIGWGAEIWRVEDGLYRICESYGFLRCDVWALATNLQMTVETPDGDILTQIREVHAGGTDYDKLTYLNDLCRYICQFTPDEEEISRRFQKIKDRKTLPQKVIDLIVVGSAASFTVFFGGNFLDALVTAVVSWPMLMAGNWLGKQEKNPVIYNIILAFLGETLILLIGRVCPGMHQDQVTIGIVMLLISGLRITNGIRDLLHKDTFTGILNIMMSVTGAAGIACGTGLALVLLGNLKDPSFSVHSNIAVQLIFSTSGCVGFAVWFGVRGKQLLTSGIGTFLNFAVYLLVFTLYPDDFMATLLSALFVSGYAFVLARVHKAPATVFLTVCILPMIPGAKLYYMMYGIVCQDPALFTQQGQGMLGVCIAIAFGFMAGDIIQHYLAMFMSWWKEIEYRHL